MIILVWRDVNETGVYSNQDQKNHHVECALCTYHIHKKKKQILSVSPSHDKRYYEESTQIWNVCMYVVCV